MPSKNSKRIDRKTTIFTSAATQLKNFTRGHVAAANSRAYAPQFIDHRGNFQLGLRRATLTAGRHLPPSLHSEFLSWLDSQEALLIGPHAKKQTTSYRSLSDYYDAEPVDFERQIIWAISRLRFSSEKIAEYEALWRNLEVDLLLGTSDNWRKRIEALEEKFGPTIRLVEIKIAAEQFYFGLEAQKKLSTKMRNGKNAGLVGFLIHYVSMRNEPSVPLSRYKQVLGERINKLAAGSFKDYISYRLAQDIPSTEEQISNILRIEEAHSPYDLFDTLNSLLKEEQSSSIALKKLRRIVEHAFPEFKNLGNFNPPIPKPLASENIGSVYRSTVRSFSKVGAATLDDFRALALCSALLRTQRRTAPRARLLSSVVDQLGSQLNLLVGVEKKQSDLGKITANFGRMPALNQLALLDSSTGTNFLDPWKSDHAALQRIRKKGAVASPIRGLDRSARLKVLRLAAWLLRLSNDKRSETLKKFSRFALRQKNLSGFHTIDANARLALCKSSLELEDFPSAWGLISSLTLVDRIHTDNIPRVAALKPSRWRSISQDTRLATLAIAADLLLSAQQSDTSDGLKRYALEDLLIETGLNKPSDLTADILGISRDEYIHFLRHVCIPRAMELLPGLNGTSDINAERRKICSILLQLDRENATSYNQEIVNIIRSERVQQGLKLVDGSRIHVDSEILIKKLSAEMAVDFERYKTLVAAGVGVANRFEEVLRNVVKPVGEQEALAIPENEADDLLLQLIGRARDKFLHDEMNGFDSYLGRRIRHNSMTGAMRAPLSQEHLITQFEKSASRYLRNNFWLDRMSDLIDEDVEIIDSALNSFSASFDSVGNDIKSRLFQLKSSTHPDGIFDVHISSNSYHLLRSMAQEQIRLEDFLNACFQVFWSSLSEPLGNARTIILRDARQRVEAAFSALKQEVARLDSEHILEFTACIERGRQAVRQQLQSIAGWFHKREISEQRTLWSLDEVVDVCIEVCMVSHGARTPKIERTSRGEIALGAESLFVLSDVLWIAIDNACTHAGWPDGVPIRLMVEYDRDNDIIYVDVENDISDEVHSDVWIKSIESIREDIEKRRANQSLRVEGRSGLKKVAAMAFSVKNGSFSFGPRNGGRTFGFRVVIPTVDLPGRVGSGDEIDPVDTEAADEPITS